MPASITVNGTRFKGRTIESIVRREYGKNAKLITDDSERQYIVTSIGARYQVTDAYEFKRPKYVSRQARWDEATGRMSSAIDAAQEVYDEVEEAQNEAEDGELTEEQTKEFEERLVSATGDFQDAQAVLQELRDEFQEWEDNLPEQFQQGGSPVSEKIQEIVDMYSIDEDVEFSIDGDTTDAQSVVDEVESADLPRGFGRD